MENENNTNIIEENTDIPEPKTPAVKKKSRINTIPEDQEPISEPETPAPKKKGRSRPAGAKNKAKPVARIPEPELEIEPEPRRRTKGYERRVLWSTPHGPNRTTSRTT